MTVTKLGETATLRVVDRIEGGDLEKAWRLYRDAFRDLNARTVQRHLMTREEFDQVMADTRVEKYTIWNYLGELDGLSTYTNILDAMPLISPAYFARRWPRLHAARKIWYCGFVAVPGHRHGVFAKLVGAMLSEAESHGGVIALDMCKFNIEALRLDKVVWTLLTRLTSGRVRCEVADRQEFHIFETAPEES